MSQAERESITLDRRAAIVGAVAAAAAVPIGGTAAGMVILDHLPQAAAGEDAVLLAHGREFEALNVRYLTMCKASSARTLALYRAVEAATGIPWANRPAMGESPEFDATYNRLACAREHSDYDDEDWAEIRKPIWESVDKIMACKPTTLAGLGVLARVVTYVQQEWWDGVAGGPSEELDDSEQFLRHFVASALSVAGLPDPLTPAGGE